jgi:hypothetical protein
MLHAPSLSCTPSPLLQVRVTEIIANTYYARVHVSRGGDPPHEVDVDARPSDAINLAVRFGAPVYISKKIAGGLAGSGIQCLGHSQQQRVRTVWPGRLVCLQHAGSSVPHHTVVARADTDHFCCRATCPVVPADQAQPVSVEQLSAASSNETHADIVRRCAPATSSSLLLGLLHSLHCGCACTRFCASSSSSRT